MRRPEASRLALAVRSVAVGRADQALRGRAYELYDGIYAAFGAELLRS